MKLDPLARAAAATVLLAVPVAFEIIAPDLADNAVSHVVFAGSQLLGWALVWTLVRSLPVPVRRGARFGRVAVLCGVACQVAFAAVYGTTAVDGEPLEASFVLFLLGFLALAVGGISWGTALLGVPEGRLAGAGLVAVASLGLLAMLVGGDPFHDIFLLASYAAWLLVGHGLHHLALHHPAHRSTRASVAASSGMHL